VSLESLLLEEEDGNAAPVPIGAVVDAASTDGRGGGGAASSSLLFLS